MQTKVKSWDLRPFSEYFFEHADGRKHFKFLYYCRECVKNFDAPVRVRSCKYCGKENLIELPKDVWKREEIFKKVMTGRRARALVSSLVSKRKPKERGFSFATKLRLAMIYYFNSAEQSEKDVGAEDVSQGDLLRNFRMV